MISYLHLCVISFIWFLTLISCESKLTSKKVLHSQNYQALSHSNDTLIFINDELVNKPFIKNISRKVLNELGYTLMKSSTFRNVHDDEKLDTTITLINRNNIFKFYVTDAKEILIFFSLIDSFSFLKSELQIESKQLIFEGKNLIIIKNKKILFRDEEEMAKLILNIYGGKIHSISGYYEYD
jgi:hypothetical protein